MVKLNTGLKLAASLDLTQTETNKLARQSRSRFFVRRVHNLPVPKEHTLISPAAEIAGKRVAV